MGEQGVCTVYDLLDKDNGKFLNHDQFRQKYSFNFDTMRYNSLVSAIPRQWKTLIKSMKKPLPQIEEEFPDVPKLKIGETKTPITSLKTRDFHRVLIDRGSTTPTAVTRWSSLYPEFVEQIDWKQVYILPYTITRSTKLQTLQYKIINRIFACRENLAKWKISDNNLCASCSVPDTLEHYFFECTSSIRLWRSFETWFSNSLGMHIPLDALTVLFGTNNLFNDTVLQIMDCCILIGKGYIDRQKSCNKPVSFFEFLWVLKNNVIIEKYLLKLEDKTDVFTQKWKRLYDAL